jgi:hypothetical protein
MYRWSDPVTGRKNWFGSIGSIAVAATKCRSKRTTKTLANCEDVCGDSSPSSSRYCWFLATAGPRRADPGNPIPPFPMLSVKKKIKKFNQKMWPLNLSSRYYLVRSHQLEIVFSEV